MNLLLIGGLPPPVGGTTVLFKQLVDDLQKKDNICLRVIDVSRPCVGTVSNILHALRCLALMIQQLPWASVLSFQTSRSGAITFGPLVHLLARLFRRKWILRGFGGDIDAWHRDADGLLRWIFDRTVLQADALLIERKASVEYFQRQTRSSVLWYPNSRHCHTTPAVARTRDERARRFVFVGHVKPAKGIGELIAAARLLASTGITIDVYGPLQDGVSSLWFADSPVRYCGPLAKEDVIQTLHGYDALILPTYAHIEGYPGVILEAYCAGIPVIATRWGGIPEIVTAQTGILVEPRNAEELASAMQRLIDSDDFLSTLRRGAQAKAAEFDADRWTQYFADLCQSLSTDSRS